DKRRSPASLTKIMTGLLAIELGQPNDLVTVSKRAQNIYTGSQIHLKKGEQIRLSALIKAALMYSANDATVAIAEHVGGNHDYFINLMNQKAAKLGAKNTKFVNTNGYSAPNHYSTAYDLALITRYALQNDTFAKLVSTKETTIHWAGGQRQKDIRNTNRLLRNHYPGVDGVKTGTTLRAGRCLIASATRGNRQLIAVVLHSDNRYQDASQLLEYGFNQFTELTAVQKGDIWGKIEVANGIHPSVQLVAAASINISAPADLGKVDLRVHIPAGITAPVNRGQQLGYVAVLFNEREVKQVPLLARNEVAKQGLLFKIWKLMCDE
ncbi:MAG: D-alanyl-D-alanine carboxypeptidase, partial [Desulfotomaculum sp.]|nr:D-alanyl-D-alanine carboxypeptidase [Desulfotomaculum sp.]